MTTVDRCRQCGRGILGGAVVLRQRDGIVHAAGLESCGRIWLCPVCSAKIRARRGDEIAEAVGRHLAADGGALFATCTLPHEHGDALTRSLDVLTKAWRSFVSTASFTSERKRYGVLGNIKAVEVTHGRNGWHPHLHVVLLTSGQVDLVDLCVWFQDLDARWARCLQRHGWYPGLKGRRFRLDYVTRSRAGGLAAYVTKVQDGGGLGNEIARGDLKGGRKTSRTPFEILADFGTNGEVRDLDLWTEFEKATAGKSAIRWSRGLRALLVPDLDDKTDEEIAAEEIGGDDLAVLLPSTWHRICAIPGATSAVKDVLEDGGFDALLRLLVAYRVGLEGVMTPDEWNGSQTL